MKSVPTAFELWHLKRGLIDDVVEDNNYMHFGRVLEPAIVQIIKDNNPEWIVSPMRAFAADDDYGIGSSYDYVVKPYQTKAQVFLKSRQRPIVITKNALLKMMTASLSKCPLIMKFNARQSLKF